MILRFAQRLPLVLLVALWLSAIVLAAPLGRDLSSSIRSSVDPQTRAHIFGPCDFLAFWTAGRMIAAGEGANVYQAAAIIAREAANGAADKLQLAFFYPPTGLLLPRLVAVLPFVAGFWAWTLGLTSVSVLVLRSAGLPWPVIIAAALSPAALLSADLGQFGFLTGALFVSGLYFVRRKAGIAGILFGALAFKPQFALLAPLALLHDHRRRGLVSGAVTVMVLTGLTLVFLGPGIWHSFIASGLPVSRYVLRQPFPNHPPAIPASFEFYGTSVLWMFRSFGCSYRLSAALQAMVSAGAGLLCWRAWRSPASSPQARIAFTACLAMLAAPYGYLYDLCGVSIAIAAPAYRERRILLSDVVLWTWPLLGLIISLHLYLELAPLAIAAAARRTWRSL